jgi:hypothetical protein
MPAGRSPPPLPRKDAHHDGPLPVANWIHVQDGKISSIQVTFDPRPLTSDSSR